MHILLTGATGFIGSNLRHTLEAMGHQVTAVSRANGLSFQTMLRPQDWLPHLKGVDAVVNAVGIIGQVGRQRFEPLHTQAPIALFEACALAGVRRVVQISALGADDTAFSNYHLSKRTADDALRRLDLDWFVLRPSLVYGKGGDSTRMFLRMAALPCLSVVGDGLQAVQPVHIRDVVDTVLKCLQTTDSQHLRQTLDVVGPQALSFVDYLQAMRVAQGLASTRCIVRTPLWLALLGTWPARYVSAVMQPENLRMLVAGSTADAGPLTQFLGRSPLPIASHLFFEDAMGKTKEAS